MAPNFISDNEDLNYRRERLKLKSSRKVVRTVLICVPSAQLNHRRGGFANLKILVSSTLFPMKAAKALIPKQYDVLQP